MQHVHDSRKPNGIDGAICIAVMVVDDLQHARADEPSQWLGVEDSEAALRIPKRTADSPTNFLREGAQIVLAAADPAHWLWLGVGRAHHLLEPEHMICLFGHKYKLNIVIEPLLNRVGFPADLDRWKFPEAPARPAAVLLSELPAGSLLSHFCDFSGDRLRRRTPGPPPLTYAPARPAA